VRITISGCGGGGGTGGGGSPTQPTPSNGDRLGNITANHGHVARITAAELAAGNAVTLQIRGDSPHPHTVALSAADVVSIRNGQQVSRASSEDDFHTHTITFN
jgi:hypothetical protein